MKLYLQNTARGLIPLYDSDFEEKKKLKIGQKYRAEIRVPRNLKFHRKYFALIRLVWENMPEDLQRQFTIQDNFRYWVQMRAGFVERYTAPNGTAMFRAKSISFGSMDEAEFSELYSKVLDVILAEVWPDMDQNVLESELMNFM